MHASRLKTRVKEVILSVLVLVALDLLAALIFFNQAQTFWLFKNTRNWVEVAADLTFTEGVICMIIAAATGYGRAEHTTRLNQTTEEAPVDMGHYRAQREKSMSQAFQIAEIGLVLILLTFVLHFL